MAVGKAKSKGGKKGAKKKIVDPFSKKDWYDVKAPNMFVNRELGKTLVNRTVGNKLATDGLRHRVYECSLADLQGDETAFKKVKLICDEVQGRTCLTNFYGMRMTTDKLMSMMKKWQTTIEGQVDAKTTDGYLLRLFCIGFTRRVANHQIAKCSYAKQQKVKKIRSRMVEMMSREVVSCDIKEVVAKLIPDSIAKDIQRKVEGIYPLYNVHIRKVKVLRRPRLDLAKLMDLHSDGPAESKFRPKGEDIAEAGEALDRPEGYEPPILDNI